MMSSSMTDVWLAGMTGVTWQFAVLVVMVWGLLGVVGNRLSARATHAIWLVVLLRLLLPVGIASPWGLAGQRPATGMEAADSIVAPERQPYPTSTPVALPVAEPEAGWNFGVILLTIWASISAMLLATWLFRAVQFEIRIRRSWEAVPEWLQEEFDLLRDRLDLVWPIQAGFVDDSLVSGPGITGFMHPRLVLPKRMLDNTTNEQRTAVIVHELIHVVRRDHIVQPLVAILQCLYFFHPAVWFVARKIRSEREKAVDDLVVSSIGERPDDYAKVLLNYAQNRRFPLQTPALGLPSHRSQVSRRLARMLAEGYRSNRRSRRSALAVMVLSIFMTLTIAASGPGTSADNGERPRVRVTITYPEAQVLRDGEPAWVELGGDFEIGRAVIEKGDLEARLSALPDRVLELLVDSTATLEAAIDRTGMPVTVKVVSAVEPSLDGILVEYTKALRFTPTLHFRDGPVPFKAQLHFGIPREEAKYVPQDREPSLGSDELETRLREIYSLRPEQALKLLPAPHPEERLELYRLRSPGQAERIPQGPNLMLIEVRDGVPWVIGNGFGGITVMTVFSMAGFGGAKISGDAGVLGREFFADIAVSEGGTREQRLSDLVREMAEQFAIRVEPIRREMQVIVVRGSFGEITGSTGNSGQPSIWITFDTHEEDGSGGGMAQTAPVFATLLETILGVPVEVEGVPDPEYPVMVRFGRSAYRTERVQELLERIEEQCDLELSLEKRKVELLYVEDMNDPTLRHAFLADSTGTAAFVPFSM